MGSASTPAKFKGSRRSEAGLTEKSNIISICIPKQYYYFVINIQFSYLIDEANATGNDANTVISLLHHFFSTHTFGESSIHLHADNCSGQNKNRHVIAYLMWRVLKQQALPVHSHMFHAPEMSMRSYQFLTIEDSIDTQHTIL